MVPSRSPPPRPAPPSPSLSPSIRLRTHRTISPAIHSSWNSLRAKVFAPQSSGQKNKPRSAEQDRGCLSKRRFSLYVRSCFADSSSHLRCGTSASQAADSAAKQTADRSNIGGLVGCTPCCSTSRCQWRTCSSRGSPAIPCTTSVACYSWMLDLPNPPIAVGSYAHLRPCRSKHPDFLRCQ